MKAKTVLTVLLLVFVLGSVAAMIYSEVKSKPDEIVSENTTIAIQQVTEDPSPAVIAYYFHGTARCVTCRTIEAYTYEALQIAFPDELKSGKLKWKTVNVEERENDHFITDYQLHTKSVVISKRENAKEMEWKNLDEVWNLVDDRDSFIAYIQDETRNYLEENNNG